MTRIQRIRQKILDRAYYIIITAYALTEEL